MFNIVLVETEGAENIGIISRAMKNFNFNSLVLINPLCNYKSVDSLKYALIAEDVIKNAKLYKTLEDYKNKYKDDIFIAFSRRQGIYRQRDIILYELNNILNMNVDKNINLVFGREKNGLTNEEIDLCEIVCYIPASKDFPSLNLATAVSIVLYELSKREVKIDNNIINLAKESDYKNMLDSIYNALDEMSLFNHLKRTRFEEYIRKILKKNLLTKKDTLAIKNLFDKMRGKFRYYKKKIDLKGDL